MICTLASLLAVMLLTDPSETIDTAAAAALSKDADRVAVPGKEKERVASAHITSRTSDFDRKEGVIMFEGDVFVRYSDETTMTADRLFMFLSGSNDLARVVAIGNVAISNDNRYGTCPMATYRRKKGEVEMFWDGEKTLARLQEFGQNAGELKGTRIKFWLDSEQVEVENSQIGVRNNERARAL